MAELRVHQVIVADTWVGDDLKSGTTGSGTFTGGADATKFDQNELAAGEFSLIDPDTALGVTAATPPTRLEFVAYELINGLDSSRRATIIEKGQITRFAKLPYAASVRQKIKVDMGTETVNLGDTFSLMLRIRNEDKGWNPPHPIAVTCTAGANNAARVTDVINKFVAAINALNVNTAIPIPVSIDTSDATSFTIIADAHVKDWTNINLPNNYYFEVALTSKITSAGVYSDGWGGVTTVATTATPSPGSGEAKQVRSHLYESAYGYEGLFLRNAYRDTPYDPVDDSLKYDAYFIEYQQRHPSAGQPSLNDNLRSLTIYLDKDGATTADFTTFFDSLMDNFQ